MYNFEDDIGLLVLKNILPGKSPSFVKEFFKSDNFEQSYGAKCLIWKIT